VRRASPGGGPRAARGSGRRRHLLDVVAGDPPGAVRLRRHLRRALAALAAGRRRPRRRLRAPRAVGGRRRLHRPRAAVAARPPRRAVRRLPHGPAPPARRPGRRRADARADALDPASRHAAAAAAGARRRPVRASRLRGGRLRGRHVVLARPGHVRRDAQQHAGPPARAPLLRGGRPPVLVAPALADPLARAHDRHRDHRLHGLDQDPGRLPRGAAVLRPRPALRLLRARRRAVGDHRARGPAGRRRTHGPRADADHGRRPGRPLHAHAGRGRPRGRARRALRDAL
ncbi:MAG: hypothetical protein AVDCRST_MAG38-465, partial [uncultured Solirubrobacteraceae bacterium]